MKKETLVFVYPLHDDFMVRFSLARATDTYAQNYQPVKLSTEDGEMCRALLSAEERHPPPALWGGEWVRIHALLSY